jgi:GT2 family glycosyltransferase
MSISDSNADPEVGIVVVNYNGLEYSRECLDSLLAIDYPNYKIIFIDNGSNDESGNKIEKLYQDRIIYLRLDKNLGVTGGNNAGIDYALKHHFKYVMFLNNDTVVEKTFLHNMVRTSQSYGDVLVVPKIICYYDRSRLDYYIGPEIDWWTSQPTGYQSYPRDAPDLNVKKEIGVASTCCLLVPVNVIKAVGKMDEQYFMYQDDSDFTIRATRASYHIIYDPESVIYHKCNMSAKNKQNSYFEFYLQNRNVFYFYRKLCNKPFVKFLFLTKKMFFLILQAFKSIVAGNSLKRKVVLLIIKDIMIKKMGAPPDFNAKY